MNALSTSLGRLRLAPDTAQRHRVVARLAGNPESVLDVGGVQGQLAAFLPKAHVTTANVNRDAEVGFDGVTLPFREGAFDVVTSLDVLEHVPPEGRARHVRECVRVARSRIVLCCPLGTPEHVAAEREIAHWHECTVGRQHPFLAEHVALGLPTQSDLEALARCSDGDATLRFHGDFRTTEQAFRAGVLARRRPGPLRLARYARHRLARPAAEELTVAPNPWTNRAYLVIDHLG